MALSQKSTSSRKKQQFRRVYSIHHLRTKPMHSQLEPAGIYSTISIHGESKSSENQSLIIQTTLDVRHSWVCPQLVYPYKPLWFGGFPIINHHDWGVPPLMDKPSRKSSFPTVTLSLVAEIGPYRPFQESIHATKIVGSSTSKTIFNLSQRFHSKFPHMPP